MSDTTREPVLDWTTDFDVFDTDFIVDPSAVLDDLRERCPVPHTQRLGGAWMPVRYEDVTAVARDFERFSSREVSVLPRGPVSAGLLPAGLPPIEADPPVHTASRRLLLPWFSPGRVDAYEEYTRELCGRLIDGFIATGGADAAADYAEQIPVRVIGLVLGVPEELSDTFTGWVADTIGTPPRSERRMPALNALIAYLLGEIDARRGTEGDDLIRVLLRTEVDGEPLSAESVLGTVALTLLAGIDTTWSAIGSAMWHLATHPADRRRLAAEPELMPTAVEELLRAYSPVTMARVVVEDTEIAGCPVRAGDKVLLNFGAANRDPAAFPDADTVVLDRAVNRHVAFGAGIHRCAGSNLARMELRVALEEWLARIPEFDLVPDADVTWVGGQVRGPRRIPVRFAPGR